MTNMRKWLKSKKALSRVCVVIILIAVTLAVPIAAAAWMGALTLTSIATEQITFTKFVWGANNANCQITVKNAGTADLSILAIRINGATPASVNPSLTLLPYSLAKGASATFTLTRTGNFTSGVSYQFTVVTTKGNNFGPYIKTAP